MPKDSEKDNFDDDDVAAEVTPKVPETVVAPAKPRLHSKLRADAEKMGISPAHIEECESNAELRELIDNARAEIRHERMSQHSPAVRKDPPSKPAPETETAVEEEWKFDEDFERDVDPSIKREVAKIGKLLLKAKKDGDKEEVAELKKQLAETNAQIARMNARSHPLQRRANAHVAKYPSLFGDSFDEDGVPTGEAERYRHRKMIDFIFNEPDKDGKNRATGNPEKDIDNAIAFLFPGHGIAQDPATPKSKPSNGTSRISQWADSGQAPATSRNGAERSGVPGGAKAAARKVAERMKAQGLDPGTIDDDEDDEV